MYYIEIGYYKFIVEKDKINDFMNEEGYTSIELFKNHCNKFEEIKLINGIMEL